MKKHYLVFFSMMLVIVFTIVNIPSLYAQKATSTGKMKFLVISERKDIYFALPQEEQMKIEAENDKYMKQVLKAGNILEFYNIPGWNRAVSIEQYENLEELYEHFEKDLYYPYVNFEVYPLHETGEAEIAKPNAKKMKFLVICEPKDIWYAMSEDERKKIEAETTTENGNFLKFYSIPGWYRYVAIEQYDSIESLYKHFEGDSGYPYANFEVYPLVEIDLAK